MWKRIFFVLILVVAIGASVVYALSYGVTLLDTDNVVYSPLEVFKPDPAKSDAPPENVALVPQTIPTANGTTTFQVAEPFRLTVAAEGLGKARFMTMSPDGRMFVPDLVDYNLSHEGKVYILEGFNEQTGQFKTTHTYLSNLRGVNSVAFYKDENGQQWLYVALTAELIRYPYEAGDTEPSGEPEVVATFPNKQVPGQSSVVWHITRTIEFRNDRLYVSVGSGCNACEDPDDLWRGMLYSMNPDGSGRQLIADGLRNAVGFTWGENDLYATANGVDHLGPNAPHEAMYQLDKEGGQYGWPYCYVGEGGVLKEDSSQQWEQDFSCATAPKPFAVFEPRSAPLGLEYFDTAHPTLRNSFLVALHGSFEPDMRAGYQIVRVTREGTTTPFITGFQNAEGERFGRPVDILQHDKNAFFFTDDMGGRIYFVRVRK